MAAVPIRGQCAGEWGSQWLGRQSAYVDAESSDGNCMSLVLPSPCDGRAVGSIGRTSKKYNRNTTHDWGVQRLYNGKYNAFNLIFKRVTMTRSYNAVQTQTLVVTINPVHDTLFRP